MLKPMVKARVAYSLDNKEAIQDADIVICTASATASFLESDFFKSGAIVCDVGYPKNVISGKIKRDDILIFIGGISRPLQALDFGYDIGLPSCSFFYLCWA